MNETTKLEAATDPAGRLDELVKRPILDACCGSRMFWFDRQNEDAVFVDKRREIHELKDKSSKGGSRQLVIDPDKIADFTSMPYPDDSFALVALVRTGVMSCAKALRNASGFCGVRVC